ncbi:urea ABC transporter permease subunit UrtB [Bifidobacterium longum]|uniref:ABC transporter permease component n=2 Tax=Bifidobacterium longum TaxID=216816 RepID=A0A0M5KUZ7_BIFLI|nr:urea ABC transporter permease subunit UrtB [Bifidobacterium longum]ALE08816.1 ABC transporter permease component [Bifidobacterium longum subsp. infantis]OQM70765.1 ABC transporter permease component [Bifidobacterium longum subsp. infantis]QOL44791.1 urea ABC transporter permease subunit UrtB [Bifidobacterium longum subsp. infantis]QSP98114.1 urea ABC transporter permease subunit UrtB [Bifidobacterium longum subsp. infantis]QSZ18361.1 urea ABC transporter permease subunit UrtB [Bifidobacteri
MNMLVPQLVAGLSNGSILLLAALGLSLTFGQMGVINNAHGEFMMAGAYTAYAMSTVFASKTLALGLALVAGFVVAGLLGLLLDVLLLSRMRTRPLDTLLVTFGVSLVLQQVARDIFGSTGVYAQAPEALTEPVTLFGYDFPASRLFIFVVSVVCVAALYAVLKFTPLGRRIRATAENRDLAEVSGISTATVDHLTFFIGSGIAGIAGVALSLLNSISYNFGTSFIVQAFLVVVAGGVGQLKGAVIASFALGLCQSAIELPTSSSIAQMSIFLIVVIFLQFRPQGLVAVRSRNLA